MNINDFKPFATSSSANVETQAAFESSSALTDGFQTGVANSAKLNKVWRQSSFVAAAIGEFIKNAGFDAADNGDLSAFLQNFLSAKSSFFNKNVTEISAYTLDPLLDANHATLYFWGALTSNFVLNIPPGLPGNWNIFNYTTGAFTLTVKITPGNSIVIPQASGKVIVTNGSLLFAAESRAGSAGVGMISYFPGTVAPTGYLEADGSVIATTVYPELVAALSAPALADKYTSGLGAGFARLPDLRGVFIRGWDHGAGIDPDFNRAVGSLQQDAFKSHAHDYLHTARTGIAQVDGLDAASLYYQLQAAAITSATGGPETRPINIAMLPCIKYQ